MYIIQINEINNKEIENNKLIYKIENTNRKINKLIGSNDKKQIKKEIRKKIEEKDIWKSIKKKIEKALS